jgi:hypothetical protein
LHSPPLALLAAAVETPTNLALLYLREVDRRLEMPAAEQAAYATRLEEALRAAGVVPLRSQYVVLVDRSPIVQAVMLFWRSSAGETAFIGASPTSTGRPGGFEHFETPIGVFAHTLATLDFRAEGTRNELGIRGYGAKGMRVHDFGWVEARRTWGKPGESSLRLQLHSTDPVLLEPRLGTVQSKGCIRIPASPNDFIDRYGILDTDYEEALGAGRTFWVLRPDRTPTRWSGRYLVVVGLETEGRLRRHRDARAKLSSSRRRTREADTHQATAVRRGHHGASDGNRGMPSRELARPQWRGYFDRVSKTLGAQGVEIEMTELGLCDQIAADRIVLDHEFAWL